MLVYSVLRWGSKPQSAVFVSLVQIDTTKKHSHFRK